MISGRSRIRALPSGVARRAARAAAVQRERADDGLLDALRAEADAAARGRSELLALLSHDLRNTLGVMQIAMHPVGRALPAEHPARRHYDMLKRAAAELGQMLDAVSESANLERGGVSIAATTVDPRALIEAAVAAARRRAEDRELTLDVEIAHDLPSIQGAADKLARVLGDLLARAVRVAPKKSAVTVRAAPDGEGVRISIADHAAPVPAELVDRVFEIPLSKDDRRAANPYFVLDLFVARGIVEAHGGRIWIEPTPGGGTTFALTLPA